MRWTRVLAATGSVAAVAAALTAVSCSMTGGSATTPAAMTAEQKIERGRHLVHTMGCNDCHTPGYLYGAADTTRLLSGSELGWTGPWGTSYPRNLTPDVETGIGGWTEEQIATTLRTGMRPDGRQLLPPMPWLSVAALSDEDMGALVAYLKSIPAVKHASPELVPPGQTGTLPALVFPPPPAWDAMNLPPPAAPPAGGSTN